LLFGITGGLMETTFVLNKNSNPLSSYLGNKYNDLVVDTDRLSIIDSFFRKNENINSYDGFNAATRS
jgi:hypothetical protein